MTGGGPLGPPSHLQWHPWALGVITFIMILLKEPAHQKTPNSYAGATMRSRSRCTIPVFTKENTAFPCIIPHFIISHFIFIYSQYEIPLMEVIILILILGRLRKGMKKLSVFSENCQISFSPPCLSLSLRENERFPIPFWQISEKTEFFTPSLCTWPSYSIIFALGLHSHLA